MSIQSATDAGQWTVRSSRARVAKGLTKMDAEARNYLGWGLLLLFIAFGMILVGRVKMPVECSPTIKAPVQLGKHFCIYRGEHGGWWAHIEGHAYPFVAWRMDRGPYPFQWMAKLEFPIERLTRDGPRK